MVQTVKSGSKDLQKTVVVVFFSDYRLKII